MRAMINLALPWNQLWLQLMSPAKPTSGNQSDSGDIMHSGQNAPVSYPQSMKSFPLSLSCWEFTLQEASWGLACGPSLVWAFATVVPGRSCPLLDILLLYMTGNDLVMIKGKARP